MYEYLLINMLYTWLHGYALFALAPCSTRDYLLLLTCTVETINREYSMFTVAYIPVSTNSSVIVCTGLHAGLIQ